MSYTRKILKVFKDNPDTAYTVKELADFIEKDENMVRVYVNRLRKAHEITQTGKISNAKKYMLLQHQVQANIKLSKQIHDLNAKVNKLENQINLINEKLKKLL